MIKSRRPRWAGHVAYMGEVINAHKIIIGKKGNLEDEGVD
jgi:hypothetical protein